jgi:hypothetical protein
MEGTHGDCGLQVQGKDAEYLSKPGCIPTNISLFRKVLKLHSVLILNAGFIPLPLDLLQKAGQHCLQSLYSFFLMPRILVVF